MVEKLKDVILHVASMNLCQCLCVFSGVCRYLFEVALWLTASFRILITLPGSPPTPREQSGPWFDDVHQTVYQSNWPPHFNNNCNFTQSSLESDKKDYFARWGKFSPSWQYSRNTFTGNCLIYMHTNVNASSNTRLHTWKHNTWKLIIWCEKTIKGLNHKPLNWNLQLEISPHIVRNVSTTFQQVSAEECQKCHVKCICMPNYNLRI